MDMANQKGSFIEYQKTGIASFVGSFIWNKIPTHKCKMRLTRTPKFQYDSWPELINLVTWAIIVQAFLNEYKISIWECRDATIILQKALEKKPKWYDNFCFVVKELWPAVPREESEEWPRLSKEREKTAQRSKAFYHSWWRVLCYLRYEVQRYINKRKPGFMALAVFPWRAESPASVPSATKANMKKSRPSSYCYISWCHMFLLIKIMPGSRACPRRVYMGCRCSICSFKSHLLAIAFSFLPVLPGQTATKMINPLLPLFHGTTSIPPNSNSWVKLWRGGLDPFFLHCLARQ